MSFPCGWEQKPFLQKGCSRGREGRGRTWDGDPEFAGEGGSVGGRHPRELGHVGPAAARLQVDG